MFNLNIWKCFKMCTKKWHNLRLQTALQLISVKYVSVHFEYQKRGNGRIEGCLLSNIIQDNKKKSGETYQIYIRNYSNVVKLPFFQSWLQWIYSLIYISKFGLLLPFLAILNCRILNEFLSKGYDKILRYLDNVSYPWV